MTTYAELHARLTTTPDHPDFAGPPIDIDGIGADELGELWPLVQRAAHDASYMSPRWKLAHDVIDQVHARRRPPRLTRAAFLASVAAIPAERCGPGTLAQLGGYLADGPDPTLEDAIEHLLPPIEEWTRLRFCLLGMARALGARRTLARVMEVVERTFGERPPAREFAVLKNVPLGALYAIGDELHYDGRAAATSTQTDPATLLVDDPHYVVFARWVLEQAAVHIERIHAGEVPYKADGAFDPDDGRVLSRAARVAALRDDPWYGDVINRLLPAVCVAPGTARTVPSQSLAVALGHVIEGVPTPESVVALRRALEVVRHAGVQKKLARHQKPAERALAQRPEVALRLLDAGLEPKRLRALLTQFFEVSLARPAVLPYAQWRARLLGNDVAAGFARTLIWNADRTFMLGEGDVPHDAAGQALAIADDAPVALWHPVEADDAQRDAWRAQLAARRVRQPCARHSGSSTGRTTSTCSPATTWRRSACWASRAAKAGCWTGRRWSAASATCAHRSGCRARCIRGSTASSAAGRCGSAAAPSPCRSPTCQHGSLRKRAARSTFWSASPRSPSRIRTAIRPTAAAACCTSPTKRTCMRCVATRWHGCWPRRSRPAPCGWKVFTCTRAAPR